MEDRLKLWDEESFRCSICCNDIENQADIIQLESCHCRFCIECIRQYCISQINTPLVLIRCPDAACDSLISFNEIRLFLTVVQFEIYRKRFFDHEVTNDPRRIFCPQVDCGHVLLLSDKQMMRSVEPISCSSCKTTFCLKCHCQWHPNQPCSDLLIPNEMDAESHIKRCPKCRFPLEWAEGCAQVMCVNCKHVFCWFCLKSLDNDFFLLHYERGPCRNRLGHSRGLLFLHRLLVVFLFIVFIILFIIVLPLIILISPCLICYQYKKIKNCFNNLTRGRRSIAEVNPHMTTSKSSINIDEQPFTSLLPPLNFDACNNSHQINDISSV